VPVPANRVDPQNVHENSVVAAVRTNIDALKALAVYRPPVNGRCVMKEVAEHLKYLPPAKAADATLVLGKLTTDTHSSFKSSEQEVLGLVWDKIDTIGNQEVKKNLRETVCSQLADCVENGLIVCSTGKISRVMSSLEGVDCVPLERARPVWAINEELGILAANVRERCLTDANPDTKAAYNSGEDTSLSIHMQDQFQKEAQRTYCEQLGMEPKILNPMLEVYKEAL
jgi:hypothetical protein